jgi:hypothetical protein
MTVTRKQTSIAIFAVIFATAMIASTLASAAYADQKITQNNKSEQKSKCVASGGVSVANGGALGLSFGGSGGHIRNSCNNHSTQTNANGGNNVD